MNVLRLPKKHILIREGFTSGLIYVLVKGAARSYYLHNGVEVHTWFAFEDEVIGSLRNYHSMPSRETIALLENSILISFDIEKMKHLMSENLEITQFVGQAVEEYALYLEDKLYVTHLKSAKERYSALMENEPEIFKRVPLTYIASFLGISRETLSRLRAR